MYFYSWSLKNGDLFFYYFKGQENEFGKEVVKGKIDQESMDVKRPKICNKVDVD